MGAVDAVVPRAGAREHPVSRLVRRVRATGPLLPLLAATAVAVTAWALFVPPWQVPDEPNHFGYVQSIAENGERPGGYPDVVRPFSLEEQIALVHSRGRIAQNPRLKPPWTPVADARWRRGGDELRGRARSEIQGVGPQSSNPPLYYAWDAVPYRLGEGGDVFDRLHLMRLWSGLLLLVATVAAWLLAGELTGRDRLLQLAAAACVGLQPMATFVAGGVNPDSAMLASWGLALWLGVRLLRRGFSAGGAVALVAALAAATLVKATALALGPAVAFALVFAWIRARRPVVPRGRLAIAGAIGACVAIVVGVLFAFHGLAGRFHNPLTTGLTDLGRFLGYVWEFYLPKLPGQTGHESLQDFAGWNVWFKGAWGSFAWLEVRYPAAIYVLLAAVSLVAFGGAAAAVARGSFRPGRAPLAFLAITAAGLVIGLHWIEFWSVQEGVPTNQGRYLLPLLPIAGVAVAGAVTNLRPRSRPVAVAAVLGGLCALQLVALGVVAGRFYA